MKLRTIALHALTVTMVLGGCSDEAEPDSAPRQEEPSTTPTSEPSEPTEPSEPPSPENVHTRIPGQTRGAHFPRAAGDYRNWLSDAASTGRTAVLTRRVLPCDDAKVKLGVDRRVLAHAETVGKQGPDNAILFTRVGALNQPVKGAGVLSDKKKNPGFVQQVRAQGDRATAILGTLSAG